MRPNSFHPPKTSRLFASLAGIALLFSVLAACGQGDSDSGENGDVVVIGTTLPLTSPLSAEAESLRNGYEMAVADINDDGGVDGKTLKLLVEDDKADPALAKQLTNKLISQDGAEVILGSYGSGTSLTQSAEAERYQIPGLYPFASVSEMVDRGFKNVFNLYPLADRAEKSTDEFLLSQVKPKSVAIMYVDNPFAIAGAESSKKTLEAAGVEVPVFEKYGFETDAIGPVSKAKRADVDVIKNIGYDAQYTSYIQALQQTNLDVDAVTFETQIPFAERSIKTVGEKAANLVIGNGYWVEGMTPKFEARYEEKFDVATEFQSVLGYSTVQVLADAVERAGGADKDALRKALSDTDLETVYGRITFDDKGAFDQPLPVSQLIDGEVVTIWPEDKIDGNWEPWVAQAKR